MLRSLLAASPRAGPGPARLLSPPRRSTSTQADAATIASSLDGVGAAKAKAIVAWRDAHGPFKSADDLAQVKGIGPATIERNRSAIQLGGARPPRPPRPSKAAPSTASRAHGAGSPRDGSKRRGPCRPAPLALHSAAPNPGPARRTDMILPRYRIAASTIGGAGKGLFLDQAVAAGSIITAPDAHRPHLAPRRAARLAGTRCPVLRQRPLVRGPLHRLARLAGRVLHQPQLLAHRPVASGLRVRPGRPARGHRNHGRLPPPAAAGRGRGFCRFGNW